MKALVTLKKKLERKIEKLEAESQELKAVLDTLNYILLEKGFKRGDIKEVPTPTVTLSMSKEVILPKQEIEALQPNTTHISEPETVIPLKTMADEPLAIIYFDKQCMHVLPDETKHFSVNVPPFGNFLVERVFVKMQEKDKELARMGQLSAEKIFSFNIVREGDLIREILIKNVDEERLKELKSSIRWTFEKMYEKMKGA
jgi:hypothetical protein